MGNKLVVVVEDDLAIRDVLTDLLEGDGYAVVGLSDGRSAVSRMQDIQRAIAPISAITLDLNLPGKDGADILKELKSHAGLRHVPVVVVSANLPPLLPQQIRPLAAAVIRKPFDVMHLLDTVSSVVGPAPSALWFPSPALAKDTPSR